jgi:hypothetical protein
MIDIVALALKYYSWYNYGRDLEMAQELAEHNPQQLFMHKYVLCDLIWDNTNVWILNQLSNVLDFLDSHEANEAKNFFDAKSLEVDAQWGRIALNATEGFRYIARLLEDTDMSLKPESLISSRILLDSSIYGRCELLSDRLTVPNLSQYEYLLWIRDRQLIKFIWKVYKRRPSLGATSQIRLALKKDFKRIVLRKPWMVCNNVLLKNQMEEEMNLFLESLYE